MIGEAIESISEMLGTALEGVNVQGWLLLTVMGEVIWFLIGQYWSTRMDMPWTVRLMTHAIIPFIAYFFAKRYADG